MSSTTVCVECGARLPVESSQCDLCGTEVPTETQATSPAAPHAPAPDSTATTATADAPAVLSAPPSVFCNACGWKNPPGARFCSQCGHPLQVLDGAPAPAPMLPGATIPAAPSRPPAPRPPVRPKPAVPSPAEDEGDEQAEATQGELGRQIVLIVGAGILLVIMLYVITIVSGSFNPTVTGSNAGGGVVGTTPPNAGAQTSAPAVFGELTPALAEQVSGLEDEIDAASGEEQIQLKRELVNLLIGSGRPDLAANVQEEVAQASAETRDWERAGMLLFEWMDALPQSGVKTAVAQRTVAALDKVLEAEPGNNDVRATLGWAALNDPTAPMRGITETNAVLEQDPNHVQANFNRGQMLLQIGRVEQALDQFEKLLTIVEPTSATHQQVSTLVQQLRSSEGTP